MNKQELIEMLRSKIEYANDIQNTTFDIFVSVATDLLRELEGKPIPPDAIWDLEIKSEMKAPTKLD